MKRAVATILLSLTAIYLGACAGASPSPTPIPSATREVPVNTLAAPSDTPSLQPTVTPTLVNAPTPSSTPGPDFGQASILSVAHLEDKRLMVSIQVPDDVEGVYDAYIGSTYLPCETPFEYPNRILCVGPEPYVNYSPEGALVRLYPLYAEPEAPPLFEAFITVPARATPTATQPVWYPPLPDLPFPLP